MNRPYVVAIAAAAAAFFLGTIVARRPAPPPSALVPVQSACANEGTLGDGERARLRSEIRATVRAELAQWRDESVAATVEAPPSAPAAAPQPQPPPPGSEPPQRASDPAVVERAHRLVKGAIASRQWSRQDALAFERSLSLLSSDERRELVTTLIPAINSGDVRVLD
jgi:hypothetical protein